MFRAMSGPSKDELLCDSGNAPMTNFRRISRLQDCLFPPLLF